MTEWLMNWTPLHWLILGAILLILEVFGTAGLLLWTGIAAFLTAGLTWLFNLGFYSQGATFALFSILTTNWWYVLYRRKNPVTQKHADLNQRLARCIGAEAVLLDDVVAGQSRVRIDDTLWRVRCSFAAKAGETVSIASVESGLLIAKEK